MASILDSTMTVREMIEAIRNNEIKVIDLANKYSCSDRTIQTKIKKLGFEWIAKEALYNFVGTDKNVYDLSIEEVFKSKVPIRNNSNSNSNTTSKNAIKKIVKNEGEKASKEVSSTMQDTILDTPETDIKDTSDITSKRTIKNSGKKTTKKASDNIDRILAGKKAKKEYRGFYLDSDVMGVIDSVGNGIKSELVNECLRKVFKDKGLL